jgi:dolichol-phosphate mannosyltransferase
MQMRLSVVVPLYNEESVLPELLRRIRSVLDGIHGGPHEVIIVDDGSIDRTAKIIEEEAKRDGRLIGISLSRNFGHQAALTAGLDYVTGDVSIVMDGDLQDPPEAIPLFLEKYQQGYDVVYAQRIRRKEPWALRLCYFTFYRLMERLSDIQVPLDAGDFGLMSRRVVDNLRRMPEHLRYLRGMRSWVGFRQIGVSVERGERHSGGSKYGILGLLKLAFDGIFSFSTVPIRAAAIVGTFAMVVSILYVLYALYARMILRESPEGFTALIMAVVFLSGVLLFFVGIVGEYVGRIYEEIKSRPVYIVGRIVGAANRSSNEVKAPLVGLGRGSNP